MEIQVLRSFPIDIPDGRDYVEDSYPKMWIADYNYSEAFSALTLEGENFILLEWDIAIEKHRLKEFERYCLHTPENIHTVPYRIRSGNKLVWVHTDSEWRWVDYGTKYCAHFGFGCTYFPISVIQQYRPNPIDRRLTDTNFSRWHHSAGLGPVPIHWDITVVHLNV